jgi:hypothetical protein
MITKLRSQLSNNVLPNERDPEATGLTTAFQEYLTKNITKVIQYSGI